MVVKRCPPKEDQHKKILRCTKGKSAKKEFSDFYTCFHITNVHVPQELTYDSVDGRVQELQVLLVPPLDTELVKLPARLE